jgi:peroxiredoxin Q/BCP
MTTHGPLNSLQLYCQEKIQATKLGKSLLVMLIFSITSWACTPPPLWAADKGDPCCEEHSKGTQPVKINSIAPDFILPSASGGTVKLSDFRGKKIVVVYFYPKDDTPICTKESCAFKDSYEVFKEAGAEVIGISSDSVESHKHFVEEHQLPFILLSDEGGKIRKLWGVPGSGHSIPGRVTYVIDYSGRVKDIFNAPHEDQKHVDEALKVVNEIKTQSSSLPSREVR